MTPKSVKAAIAALGADEPAVHPLGMITIQLVRAPGWMSKAIAWWGSSWNGYSHADIVLSDGRLLGARSDRIKLKDGTTIPAGVQVRPDDYGRWERRTLFNAIVPLVEQSLFENWALQKVGDAYDRDGILRLILGRKPVEDGSYFCSCLILSDLQAQGIVGKLAAAPQDVSPDGLALVLSALKWTQQEIPV